MQISDNGLQQIIRREGVILHAYQDSVGVWTIGTGHTSAAGPPRVTSGLTITQSQNDQILRDDLKPIEQQFTEFVSVPVTQNQYDAIISIVFNVGPKFWHSTAIQRLNAGDVSGAAQAIMLWNKPAEIIGRRKTEQTQFLTPDSTSTGGITDLGSVAGEVSEATGIFTTLKDFFTNTFVKHVPAAGTVAAGTALSSQSNHWPYIVAGTVILVILIWFGVYLYERKTS